jgi:cytochrome P450
MREFRADSLGFLLRASVAHGDLFHFRVGPMHTHVVNSAELARAVLVDRASEFHRSALTKSVFGRVIGNGLLVSDGDFHRRQRRLSQPAFLARRIETYGDMAAAIAEHAVSTWSSGEERSIDHEMEKVTLAVIARALFSIDVQRDAEHMADTMRVLQQEMRSLFRSVLILPPWLPIPQNVRLRRATRRVDAILLAAIRARRASGVDGGDLLSMLLSAVDEDGTGTMNDAQLRDEAITLFLAGFETVANGLTWLWYALTQNPDVEAQLHAELDSVLRDRAPTAADFARLPYTETVVKEALRLHSPIWAFNRTPIEDVVLNGWLMKRGEMVLVSPPVLHLSARYFDDPLRFRPSRFAKDAAPVPRGAYLPFGAGPHVCIGAQLALVEMTLVVAAIARRFSVALVPGQTVERETLVSVCPKRPIQVRLVARSPGRAA